MSACIALKYPAGYYNGLPNRGSSKNHKRCQIKSPGFLRIDIVYLYTKNRTPKRGMRRHHLPRMSFQRTGLSYQPQYKYGYSMASSLWSTLNKSTSYHPKGKLSQIQMYGI
ncbi:hypothetical protein CDAR_481641 [Caerostris darwini]|uniref:Ribosomal protein L2 n=1 Tax=Caerostris darwini TaxID=1538125 RepID=A0AAV4UVZ8_9ARAC|nr:hypothetical protein CDAR_481641 [Caerostris darwini]